MESKLDSVPDLVTITKPVENQNETEKPPQNQEAPAPPAPTAEAPTPAPSVEAPAEAAQPVVAEPEPAVKVKTVAEDERYSKFFKMLKMGVPMQVLYQILCIIFLICFLF